MIDERPAINLAVHEGIGDEQLIQVLLGIEEEGVPSRVKRLLELNPLTLAHRVAVLSRLGVGLGIVLDYVIITIEKLPERRLYLAYFLGRSERAGRIIRSNVVRLVKRSPLREPERSQ